jgi:ATP-dependent DNA ligase
MDGRARGERKLMRLPVMPPVSPMLAKLSREMPVREDLWYEPKWDGFRCIVFRDGDEIELGSRNERPLTRYFPELVAALQANTPERCVLDGEVVIASANGRLDFDALQQRIHPADSRVRMLAEATPSSYVAFDLLAIDDTDLRPAPYSERRTLLEQRLAGALAPVHVTPATRDAAVARDWFARFEGAGLDGVIAKPAGLPYRAGERSNIKVKHERTADCVVAGFRTHKDGAGVGSLLLGLFDDDGVLHHLGVASSFSVALRRQLVDDLAPYRPTAAERDAHPWAKWAEFATGAEGEGGRGTAQRRPGAVSRWNAKKDLSWEALRPELVVEVGYDNLQGDRFRHATSFRRWRTDRDPASCTYSQLEAIVPLELEQVFRPE